MEPAEQISEEWNSLSGVYTAEEADFLNQLLGNCSVPEQLCGNFNLGTPSAFWPGHESTIASVLQGSSSSADSSNIFPTTSGGNYSSNNPVINFGYMPMDFSLGDSKFSPYSVQGNDNKQINENTDEEFSLDTGKEVLADKNLQAHKILISEPEEDKTRSLEKSGSGKRSRSSIEVPKNMRNVKSKKNPKSACISNPEEEARSPGPQGQTLSSYCSDDDSNACQELNGGASSSLSPNDSRALKLSGKSRSNRGSATDPQSAYARRRRERINERLRILQNLVPNGTKVDISTMLEEVVQYVKFLQLQIKLLSSDDLWMYAPIAYNGMNILNITPAKQPKEMHSNKRGCSNLKAKGAIL